MAVASRPPTHRPWALARGAVFVDRTAARLGALGIGAFAWPPLIGMGLGTGTLMLREPRFAAGILKHRSTLEFSKPALTGILVYTVATVLVALASAFVIQRRRSAPSFGDSYLVAIRRMAVLTTFPFVLALGEPLEPAREWLALGFALATATVATYSFSGFLPESRSAAPGARAHTAGAVVVGLAMVLFAVQIVSLAIAQHVGFGTGRADLGAAVDVLRETGLGRLLHCSLCASGSPIPRHFEPIVLLLAPLFRLHPTAEMLLVFQTVCVTLGAPAAFLLAKRVTGSVFAATVLAIAYLAHPGVQGAALSGYHSLALTAPLLLWLLHFLEVGRVKAYAAMLVLVLATREDVALTLLGVALFAILSGRREQARLGFFTLGVATAYGLAVLVFRGPSPLSTLLASMDLPGAAAIPTKVRPRGLLAVRGGPFWSYVVALSVPKMDYAAKLLAPLLGLPLLAAGRIALGYGAILALVSSTPDYATLHGAETSLVVPFLIAGTASALARVAHLLVQVRRHRTEQGLPRRSARSRSGPDARTGARLRVVRGRREEASAGSQGGGILAAHSAPRAGERNPLARGSRAGGFRGLQHASSRLEDARRRGSEGTPRAAREPRRSQSRPDAVSWQSPIEQADRR